MYRIESQKSPHVKKEQEINVSYNQMKDVPNVDATAKSIVLCHFPVYDEHDLH